MLACHGSPQPRQHQFQNFKSGNPFTSSTSVERLMLCHALASDSRFSSARRAYCTASNATDEGSNRWSGASVDSEGRTCHEVTERTCEIADSRCNISGFTRSVNGLMDDVLEYELLSGLRVVASCLFLCDLCKPGIELRRVNQPRHDAI